MIDYNMPVSIIPDNETVRLETLKRFKILDTMPESDFEAIAILASEIFDTDKAHICFVDSDHIFIKAGYCANNKRDHPREQSFCALSTLKDSVTVYQDTQALYQLPDFSILENKKDIRFYAAAPIRTSEGYGLGTVCVYDSKPRTDVTAKQLKVLQSLADMVMEKLELRLANIEIIESYDERLHRLSHDLKNPVTSISLYAQLLGSREMSAEKVFSMATKIENSSKRIETILGKAVQDS